MLDESATISAKTWTRTVDPINKEGYSDGFVDGQKVSFQTSFDLGYSQGFLFGLKLGFQESMTQLSSLAVERQLHDTRRINCQICIDNNLHKQNIGNLFNAQKERNDNYFKNLHTFVVTPEK